MMIICVFIFEVLIFMYISRKLCMMYLAETQDRYNHILSAKSFASDSNKHL